MTDKLDVEIPDFLRKRGITSVSDNVPKGMQVQVPSGRFMLHFQKEVTEALTKPASTQETDTPEKKKHSEQDLRELQEALAEGLDPVEADRIIDRMK